MNTASIPSKLATTSITTALTQSTNKGLLVVGERGHIINWQSKHQYNQEISPVSLLLTDITVLSNGTKLAVGHDGAIISSPKDSDTWHKLFNGFGLIKLKAALLKKQILIVKENIKALDDEDEIEEAAFALEDLEFALEDTQNSEETGPNLPLLSVTQTSSDTIMVTGAYGTLLVSNDLGQTWLLSDNLLNNPEKYHLNSIVSENNMTYIAGEQGSVFKSLNNGRSWQSINTPYNGSMFGILAQKNSTNLVTFGLKGNYFVSNDQGEHWKSYLSENKATLLGGNIAENGDVVLVGHGGTVLQFNINTPSKTNLVKHPSGSALSAVSKMNDQLILVGQFGITSIDSSTGNLPDNKGVSQ
ncbi:MAG: sialidase [Colwellia sp.]|nr:sialidase [Colwellia sp.]